MEGTIAAEKDKVCVNLDDGRCIELKGGDEFEVLVFTSLMRFEWITVKLKENAGEFTVLSPNSRHIDFSQIKRVRV